MFFDRESLPAQTALLASRLQLERLPTETSSQFTHNPRSRERLTHNALRNDALAGDFLEVYSGITISALGNAGLPPAKKNPRCLQDCPPDSLRGPQDRPTTAQEAFKHAPKQFKRAPRRPKRPPRRLQEGAQTGDPNGHFEPSAPRGPQEAPRGPAARQASAAAAAATRYRALSVRGPARGFGNGRSCFPEPECLRASGLCVQHSSQSMTLKRKARERTATFASAACSLLASGLATARLLQTHAAASILHRMPVRPCPLKGLELSRRLP